jgi:hypothetical protein
LSGLARADRATSHPHFRPVDRSVSNPRVRSARRWPNHADAPLVGTTSGSLGGLVNQQRLSELPLNGRNFNDLLLQNRDQGAGFREYGFPFW